MNSRITTSRTVIVTNPDGWHLRAASVFAQVADRFESKVEIVVHTKEEPRRACGTSVLQMVSLGIPEGSEVLVEATGSDAEDALRALTALIQMDFDDPHEIQNKKRTSDAPDPETSAGR
ncbi:MAG: HPr family phosphocarrier protein [Planctomycetes bacterium]|nr:HPr family phosphocarrier protein [Planctomycetota bacterium]